MGGSTSFSPPCLPQKAGADLSTGEGGWEARAAGVARQVPPHPTAASASILFWGWNTLTYIHLCSPGPALREGDSDGDRSCPPQGPGSSSLHPLCPLEPNVCLPQTQGSLPGEESLRIPRLRREGCWQVPRPDPVLAVIHTPSPHSSSLQCCEVTAIFIPIL